MQGAIISVKLSIVPVKRGYWENKIGKLTSGCDLLSCVASLSAEILALSLLLCPSSCC